MASILTLHLARRAARHSGVPGQINTLSGAFIAGLAMFGLASNGTCLACLEASPLNSLNEATRGTEPSAAAVDQRLESRSCRA